MPQCKTTSAVYSFEAGSSYSARGVCIQAFSV